MEFFLNRTNPDLTADEIQQIMDTVRLAGSESDFATLHKVYDWMVNGIQFTPQAALPRMVNLIEFEDPEKNVFRAVNQFTVEYTNNGQTQTRRPDILLFVNGMPLCIIELKNPADKTRRFTMHGNRSISAIGAIFRICCIIARWPAFPMV